MIFDCRLRSSAIVAATLLVAACQDLQPDRRQTPVAVVAAADSAPAKPRPPAPRRDTAVREATGPEAEAAFRETSQTLRRLVAAEQSFFAETGAYSADLGRVGFRPVGASKVEFLWVAKEGWAARATHPVLEGRDCVTFTGGGGPVPATRRLKRSGRQGVVVCDLVVPAQPVRRPAPPPRDTARTPAHASSPPPAVVDTTSALDAVNPSVQMRVDLRKMVQAQTAYFGTQNTYSRRVETLPLQFGWQRGVSVQLIHADQRGWSARATHQALPDKSCVVWFGKPLRRPMTAEQQRVPPQSGVPVCDD
jgi:hypothetical protein